MAIITISRGSYSHGRRVAEKVAQKLGYKCVSRESILKASHHFTNPEMEVFRAAHGGPAVLHRFSYGKERYVAYVRKALLDCLRSDNVVYHGFAGHLFVQGVSHVLKVRVIADLADRAAEEMSRKGITAAEARERLQKDDEAHHRWSHYIYGIDVADPKLYDLVIPIHSMTTDEAADIICQAAGKPCFQSTPESLNFMRMLHLAAQVQVSLMEETPFAKVGVEDSNIVVTTKGYWTEGKKVMNRVGQIIDHEGAGVGIKLCLTGR